MTDMLTLGREPDPARRLRSKWGENIANIRQLRELSRAAVADHLEISAAAVGMWERGETAPRYHHQIALAELLDVPHAVLFPIAAA